MKRGSTNARVGGASSRGAFRAERPAWCPSSPVRRRRRARPATSPTSFTDDERARSSPTTPRRRLGAARRARTRAAHLISLPGLPGHSDLDLSGLSALDDEDEDEDDVDDDDDEKKKRARRRRAPSLENKRGCIERTSVCFRSSSSIDLSPRSAASPRSNELLLRRARTRDANEHAARRTTAVVVVVSSSFARAFVASAARSAFSSTRALLLRAIA